MPETTPATLRTVLAAATAMVAFASNSILCRFALGAGEIDAVAFTVVRLASGAVALALLVRGAGSRRSVSSRGDWPSAAALFAYAALFSFAYLRLAASRKGKYTMAEPMTLFDTLRSVVGRLRVPA